MRVVLASICATYTHTPLALYALKAYCAEYADDIFIEEFNLNHTDGAVLRRLYGHKPDVAGFSCYIWNIEKTLRVAASLKKLLPSVIIVFGGPEVSDGYDDYLLNGLADVIIPGEGEQPLYQLLKRCDNHGDYLNIPGTACLADGRVNFTPRVSVLNLNSLPFPYPAGFDALNHRIIYYEASRGCPFQCAYCHASGLRLRLRPIDDALRDMRVFLDAGIKRVKFTDRTFNADAAYALRIWRFLTEYDNHYTNFHFEIAADLLDNAAFDLLARARPELFQFEIGVQTINGAALRNITRATSLPRVFEHVRRLRALNNTHLHLDLIAGLPGEDLTSFKNSFDAVYALRPHLLQLGFLKVLKGTELRGRAAELGVVYADSPPYEVLYTRELSYADIILLKDIEDALETYHNGGRFTFALEYLINLSEAPFGFFERLVLYLRSAEDYGAPRGKARLYETLYAFGVECPRCDSVILRDLLRFDLLANENEKHIPPVLFEKLPPETKRRVRAFANNKKDCRIERFNTDILPWLDTGARAPEKRECFILFDYAGTGRQNPFTLRERAYYVNIM